MNLNEIPSGATIILDANILLYAVQAASEQCKRLLTRCATEEVTGVMPMHILAEVMHVLMLAEARDYRWIGGQNLARRLAQQPDRVKALVRYEAMVRDILGIGILLEPLQREDFLSAMGIVRQAGLLTNDALMIAVGQRLRILGIASADRQLASIQGMSVYMPDDLQQKLA